MFSAFQTFGKLGALASSVARAWSPLALWPDGIATPGMWISPRDLTSQWADYTGTTPVSVPGTVADASNPVGLALDIRAGATVLTDPGNHMLQSTSAARPLLSARVNLLTYTEDFSNAVWFARSANVTRGANLLTPTTDYGSHYVGRNNIATAAGAEYDFSVKSKANGYNYIGLLFYDLTTGKQTSKTFNVSTGAVATQLEPDDGITSTATINGPDVDGYYECSILTAAVPGGTAIFDIRLYSNTPEVVFAADGTSAVNATDIQVSLGAQSYQAVLGDGSTYATDFPVAQKYDGVDDGMATAAFAAGTLIDGMDCMIVVRRDSAALVIAGLYETAGSGTRYTGYAESNTPGLCFAGAGAPTVWVDDVQLSGGTSVTAGTLHTALTVGDWHILEFRNLDLSAWTAAAFGRYTGGIFNGPRGDILLYPSTDPTEDKDAARQWLAAYYGVTLP